MSDPVETVPKRGQIVHWVSPIDNGDMEIYRGMDCIAIVKGASLYDKVQPPIYETVLMVMTGSGFLEVRAFLDQERQLPGTWHVDDDCLALEIAAETGGSCE